MLMDSINTNTVFNLTNMTFPLKKKKDLSYSMSYGIDAQNEKEI